MNRSPRLTLIAGLCLALVVVAGIFFVSHFTLGQELMQVAMLVFGIFSTAALTIIFRAVESGGKNPIISITFNEASAAERIRTIGADVIDAEIIEGSQWQNKEDGAISAAALVGRDNNLALAKLRMDLEQAVQRIARKQGIEEVGVPYNPRILFDRLVEHKYLPIQLVSVWREVLSACNKAIHGSSVDDETAESIIRVGMQLLFAIQQTAKKRTRGTPL